MGGPCHVDGVAYSELDNFLKTKFIINGVEWYSAEQYFQAMKFTDTDYQEVIRGEMSGAACWTLGNTREYQLRPDWERVKVQVMYDANYAKFSQNEELKNVLISTKSEIKAHGFPFWAKWNGILLERIREELREECDRNETKLAERIEQMETYAKEN
eukprot:m.336487 g.336487  ORF g.336487 m.336487 type:complete len:157 (+) comp17866_c0_seq1:312-782(+)